MGECLCEFDECSEFVFDRLEDQCPNGNEGPTCALNSFWDNTEEIGHLFEGEAPLDSATEGDIAALSKLLDRLVQTRYRAEEILTGSTQNMTTLSPMTTLSSGGNDNDYNSATNDTANGSRKKRSYVPLSCSEVVRVLQDINDLLSYHVTDQRRFRFSTIYRWCNYIFETDVTVQDCESDNFVTDLQQEIGILIENTNSLHQEIQNEIIRESEAEMSRVAEAYKNHTIKLNETMEARMKDFKIQQEAEEILIAQAITDREQEPTTLPSVWCEYVCSENSTVRRRRQISNQGTHR